MSKTVTLRLRESIYELFSKLAEEDNRTLSNFIETSVLRHIEENIYVDEYEMVDIQSDKELNRSIKRGVEDAKLKKGRFVERI